MEIVEILNGYSRINEEIKQLCYADNADLIEQFLYTRNFNHKQKEFKKQINASITKSMTISKEPVRRKLANDLLIEHFSFFNYTRLTWWRECNIRNDTRCQTNSSLWHIMWKNKYLSRLEDQRFMGILIPTTEYTTADKEIFSSITLQMDDCDGKHITSSGG